jgi:hypothetical protein
MGSGAMEIQTLEVPPGGMVTGGELRRPVSSSHPTFISRVEALVILKSARGCSFVTMEEVESIRNGTTPSPTSGTMGKLESSGATFNSATADLALTGVKMSVKAFVSFSQSEKAPSPTIVHGAGRRRNPDTGAPKLLLRSMVFCTEVPTETAPKSTLSGITQSFPGGFLIRIEAVYLRLHAWPWTLILKSKLSLGELIEALF